MGPGPYPSHASPHSLTPLARAAETGHRWRNPVWWYKDGNFAEW